MSSNKLSVDKVEQKDHKFDVFRKVKDGAQVTMCSTAGNVIHVSTIVYSHDLKTATVHPSTKKQRMLKADKKNYHDNFAQHFE